MTYTIPMFFLPAICFVLGVFFVVFGQRHHEGKIVAFGFVLFVAALGTGLITFFALNTLD